MVKKIKNCNNSGNKISSMEMWCEMMKAEKRWILPRRNLDFVKHSLSPVRKQEHMSFIYLHFFIIISTKFFVQEEGLNLIFRCYFHTQLLSGCIHKSERRQREVLKGDNYSTAIFKDSYSKDCSKWSSIWLVAHH